MHEVERVALVLQYLSASPAAENQWGPICRAHHPRPSGRGLVTGTDGVWPARPLLLQVAEGA
jgi:hypothetical protein